MEREFYLSQIYLPHYFIQEENVSTKLDDMDISKPVRLQIYSYIAFITKRKKNQYNT